MLMVTLVPLLVRWTVPMAMPPRLSVWRRAQLRERRLQVELLRDRKIIEMESNLKKATHSHMDDLTKRLVDINNACKDRAMALHVQLPFHQYEQELVESGVLQDHPN